MRQVDHMGRTFLFVHGARHGAWCWDAVGAELRRRGHRAVAVDLPIEDPTAGALRYAEVAAAAIAEDEGVTVVGHSLGGLVIGLLPQLRPVDALVFVCAPLPVPGRSLWQQLSDEPDLFVTGSVRHGDAPAGTVLEPDAQAAIRTYFHDCPPDVARQAAARLRVQSTVVQSEPSPVTQWPPDVPVRYVLGRDDRILNPAWSRRAVPQRLGVMPVELPTGHSPFLAAPGLLVDVLLA
jgi:pimeloyl-ACP methyl ester carboxylesterase